MPGKKNMTAGTVAAGVLGVGAVLVALPFIGAFKLGKFLYRQATTRPPYVASDGRVYDHRETPAEYAERRARREAEERSRIQERERKRARMAAEIQAAEEDLVRASYGFAPGEGHIASDGRVYPHRETEQEYHDRKLKVLRRKADEERRRHGAQAGEKGGGFGPKG